MASVVKEERDLPGLLYRRTAGTSIRDPHQRPTPPAQIIRDDGSMVVGVPPQTANNGSSRSRALDRWMVVMTSPTNTEESIRHRRVYQRLFLLVMAINLVVNTVLLCIFAVDGGTSIKSSQLTPGTTRRLGAPDDWDANTGGTGMLDGAVSFTVGAPAPVTTPGNTDLATFSSPTSGEESVSFDTFFAVSIGNTVIGLFGAAAVWAASPTCIIVYMLGWLVWFYYTVFLVPSFPFATRYVLDFVLLYIAESYRTALMPTWFAAQQFT